MQINPSLILNAVYPIGSIYMSVNSTNPSTLFGGTWAQLKDRFLLGCGDTYSNGDTGGYSNHSHDRGNMYIKLYDEGSGTVWMGAPEDVGGYWGVSRAVFASERDPASYPGYAFRNGLAVNGETGSQSSMPPYLAVYMWKRTA